MRGIHSRQTKVVTRRIKTNKEGGNMYEMR